MGHARTCDRNSTTPSECDSEKSIDLIMFPNVDEKYLASFDYQLEHYPIADVDGYGRQATETPPETMESQGRVIGIQFK